MPHVHITVTGQHTPARKRELMDRTADTIHSNTSTPLKNVYVYIHEMDPENVRKLHPLSALIDDDPGSHTAGQERHHDRPDRHAGGNDR